MRWVNYWLGGEIYFVHIGHGLLFGLVIVILALHLPWWGMLAGSPLILFSVVGWIAEATIVLPAANRLLKGEPLSFVRQRGDDTATTRPRG
jgi:xanthosine utilization system XapX-like protein